MSAYFFFLCTGSVKGEDETDQKNQQQQLLLLLLLLPCRLRSWLSLAAALLAEATACCNNISSSLHVLITSAGFVLSLFLRLLERQQQQQAPRSRWKQTCGGVGLNSQRLGKKTCVFGKKKKRRRN